MNKMKTFVVAALLAMSATAGAADHLYQLNGSLSDSLGGPDLIANGGTLTATHYVFGKDQGLTLPVALGGVYTIDMVMNFDNYGGWQKIIDFSNLSADAGMYTYGSQWNFYPVGGGGTTPDVGKEARLTVTRDAASNVGVYVNGSLTISFNDSSGYANFGGNNANFFIDDFHTSQNEATSGAVDYIRTWDHALTADEVGRLASPVPEPDSIAMLAVGLGMLAVLRRRVRK